jgi:hypothetical protein
MGLTDAYQTRAVLANALLNALVARESRVALAMIAIAYALPWTVVADVEACVDGYRGSVAVGAHGLDRDRQQILLVGERRLPGKIADVAVALPNQVGALIGAPLSDDHLIAQHRAVIAGGTVVFDEISDATGKGDKPPMFRAVAAH